MSKEIRETRGHVIICGFGRVGRVLAGELRANDTPVLLVDTDASRLAEAEALGYHVLVGDALEERVLREANIAAAKVVAVVLPAAAGANRIARMITHPSAE